jgi:hypothetical protein
MANVSVSTHGTSFKVQDETRLDRVTRYGWGIEIAARHGGAEGPAAWVHASVPIAAAWEALRVPGHGVGEFEGLVQLEQVSIGFDASADPLLHISNLHLWNGGSRVAAFDDLNERGPSLIRGFNPAIALEGSRGLNLSIGVEFAANIDDPNPPPAPAVVLYSASAFFLVE